LFRRRKDIDGPAPEGADAAALDQISESDESAAPDVRSAGPFDIDEVHDDVQRVDLGSLLVTPQAEREVRIQVDEATNAVSSVLIAGPNGALELRAFAAPRHGDLWASSRESIAAEAAQRGGTATEQDGRFGPELVLQLAVQLPDGRTALQPQRVVGVNGPRWMLRGTFLGAPAERPEAVDAWNDTLAGVVVRRGAQAMPPGDALPLTLPPGARQTG
jgi:hypothetical protein